MIKCRNIFCQLVFNNDRDKHKSGLYCDQICEDEMSVYRCKFVKGKYYPAYSRLKITDIVNHRVCRVCPKKIVKDKFYNARRFCSKKCLKDWTKMRKKVTACSKDFKNSPDGQRFKCGYPQLAFDTRLLIV